MNNHCIIDTHAHLHDHAFDDDRKELLSEMHGGFSLSEKDGSFCIDAVIDVAAEKESLSAVVEMTRKYDFIYGALGLHPDEIADLNEESEGYIRGHLNDPKIVAVGEIGLDYYWNKESREVQINGFKRQIELALEYEKPVIIHSREAAEDTLNVIREYAAALFEKTNGHPGIMHCYSYSLEQARIYTGMGFMLGIGGVVTYKNAKKLKEVVSEIPLKNLVLETDCPYLPPVPHRGERNDSRYLPFVVSEIAALKGVSEEEVIRVTAENARALRQVP